MMTAVVSLVILIFASMLTRCCTSRVCNVKECKASGGSCLLFLCPTSGSKCGDGESCDKLYKHISSHNRPVCINGRCRDDVCGKVKDDTETVCITRGTSCGKDNYCNVRNKCVNGTCMVPGRCTYQEDKAPCALHGTCSKGICMAKCTDSKNCRGYPCVDNYCADVFCGESVCFKL